MTPAELRMTDDTIVGHCPHCTNPLHHRDVITELGDLTDCPSCGWRGYLEDTA